MNQKIEMHKQYRTDTGLKVRILCVDRKNSKYPVVARLEDNNTKEYIGIYTAYGISCSLHNNLIEYNPLQELKIDDKVFVRDDGGEEWFKRYFAGIDQNGNILTFINGTTSWSAEDATNTVSWDQWKTE